MFNFKILQQKIASSRQIQIKLSLVLFGIVIVAGAFFWLHARRYVNTDNAYVNANIVRVASQVNGRVLRLNVQNNQFVKAGVVLFELDAVPFQVAVDKESAHLASAEAAWRNAQMSTKRIVALAKNKVTSVQEQENAIKNLQVAEAAVQLERASLAQAELDLQNSKVFAVTDGYVTNMTLCVGSMVTAFQPLFALISNEQYWVDANLKETELHKIKPGQTAEILVDMYPSYVFKGKVESISGGSGAAFSLLPSQNATGNWIKITQRVPVKIHILNPSPQYPLCIGTTATVSIDTHSNTHDKR
jgi:membrane fusion protein, multidrug efflux system